MTTKPVQQETIASKLTVRWEQVVNKFELLAEEFPENKYNYSPVDGVRTFGDVLRHIAFWNRYVADSVRDKKADGTANELPKAEYSTKTQLIDALRHSATDATSALKERGSSLSPETAELVVSFIEHTSEHYGQLVVYSRLNGIVPPVSRA